jgi:hypothetical protein
MVVAIFPRTSLWPGHGQIQEKKPLTVLAALVDELVRGNGVFGDKRLTLTGLVERLLTDAKTRESKIGRPLGRALDSFVEAPIHGPIDPVR